MSSMRHVIGMVHLGLRFTVELKMSRSMHSGTLCMPCSVTGQDRFVEDSDQLLSSCCILTCCADVNSIGCYACT